MAALKEIKIKNRYKDTKKYKSSPSGYLYDTEFVFEDGSIQNWNHVYQDEIDQHRMAGVKITK